MHLEKKSGGVETSRSVPNAALGVVQCDAPYEIKMINEYYTPSVVYDSLQYPMSNR